MQNECAICGILFDSARKNRKYCEDCAAHTRTRRNEYERATQRSHWRGYYEDILEHTCRQCGKTFKMPQYLVDREFTVYEGPVYPVFCSKRCLAEWCKKKDRKEQEVIEEMSIEQILEIYSKPGRR